MRIVPILTAVLVTVFLFFIVVKRDDLMSFASAEAAEPDMSQNQTPDASATETPKTNLVRVIAIRSQSSPIGSAVILRGQTEADRQVEVRAETTARVISAPLPRGSRVSTGQTLCELDPGTRQAALGETKARLLEAKARVPETKARLDEAYARLEEAEINNNAAKKLSEGGFASETRVASAQAAVRAAEAGIQAAISGVQSSEAGIEGAEAAVAVAEREIEHLTIRAPFAGLLETDSAELGSLMQPGSLCATVIRLDPIKVVGFVPETEVARLKVGAFSGARLATGQEVSGLVTFLSRSADQTTRTFRVEIDVPNPDLAIRDGQTAEIAIKADGADAHLVPQSALTLNDEGTMGVRTIDDQGLVDFSAITIMRDSTDGIWVTGLADQANVIIIGQEYVVKGVQAEAVFQEADQ
ncbi:membrane fusion protein, multidrug efflux system [Shimia gijangensis]|uniref:Membrane fusion protein, multidrug efflux system n=1 Tax=Shimia gijangensis TaxID=1470563 RepID=A0A1M6E7W8_9RHOB|nr:efflux RND transporter periplasmic adaptor subunit [Shimia gijangensis]SHI81503.1 membrane fusion protein, multidrug efflux system [Shimia gijangensis]